MLSCGTRKTLAAAALSVCLSGGAAEVCRADVPVSDPDFSSLVFIVPSAIGWDYLYTIRPGPSGSFYLSGHHSLMKLNPSDMSNFLPWSISFDFRSYPDIGVDAAYNVYAVSDNNLAQKYSPDGTLVRSVVLPYAGPGYQSKAMGLSFDAARNNLYVCGAYYNSGEGGFKTYVALYDGELNHLKTEEYGIAGGNEHYAVPEAGIGIDAAGNVYVGGNVGESGANKYMALKYSPGLGQLLWAGLEPGPRPRSPIIRAVPGGGAVMVDSGNINPADGLPRPALRRISANGVFVASMTVSVETIERLVVGPEGSAYIIAYDATRRLVLGRVKPDNTYAWSPGFFWDLDIEAVYVDGQNRIYTSGFYEYYEPFNAYYFFRYIQPQEPAPGQYALSKVSPPEPHVVDISTYSAPLVSLVRDAEGKPARDIALTFNISTWPAGAVGQELTKTGGTTNPQGLADVQLKPGNIPAEYGVTTKCASCAPETSSVTFTCCGKLTDTDFKQYDVAWSTHSYDDRCHLIGSTVPFNCNPQSPPPNSIPFTIRQRGCAMTAMADVLNYYHDHYSLTYVTTTPLALNQYLRDNAGFDNGDVDFNQVENYTSSERTVCYSGKTDLPRTTLAALRNRIDANLAQGNPVILRVPSATNPSHFVVAIGKCAGDYLIADPGQNRATINPSQIRGIREFSLVTGSVCPTP